jgi:hypothetical protein
MSWHRACVAVAIALGCFTLQAAAPKKPQKTDPKTDPGRPAVEKVLRSEVVGSVDRRDQLAEVLKTRPDSPAARWHAGFVKDGAAWRSFDEPLRDDAAVKFLDGYCRRRNESPQDFRSQLKLANWCRKEGAKDLERAHLLAALRLGPAEEQPALLERLGYVQVGTQWLSSEQVRDCQNAIRQAQASLKKWSPKLERIAQRLDEGKLRREGALAELRPLAEPSAVPAIELILAGRSAEAAHLVVELLRQIKGPAASLGLAKQAVFSSWPEVRRSASSALKERTFEDFVPALISLLATPAVGQQSLFYDPSRGALVYSYVVACEMENQFQVAALNVVSPTLFVPTPVVVVGDATGVGAAVQERGASLRLGGDTDRSRADVFYSRERQRDAVNDRIEELNAHVIGVLAEITGLEPSRNALRLADESIVCTKGHRLWSSGSGWTKARDLEPETLLHTATATTPVRSVKAAPAEKTYNLIVDGFHTYFVGKTAVLCEDLRRTNPTDQVVPGLSSR